MFTGNLLSARVFVSMVATAVLTVSQVIGREDKVEENYRAFAVNMSILGPNTSTLVDLHITRWSTEAEREALLATLMEKAQEAFVEALRKQEETGWVRAGSRRCRDRISKRAASLCLSIRRGRCAQDRLDHGSTHRPGGGGAQLSLAGVQHFRDCARNANDGGAGRNGTTCGGNEAEYDQENKRLEVEIGASEPVRLTRVYRTN